MAGLQQHQQSNMDLIYHQTIIPTQKITHCVVGTFTLYGATDFVVVRHDTLELWTLHAERNMAECVHSTRLFANIYQIAAVPTSTVSGRSSGGGSSVLGTGTSAGARAEVNRLVVTSETGSLVLLRYDLDEMPVPTRLSHDTMNGENHNSNDTSSLNALPLTSLRGKFVRLSDITLGRSGARLTVPGARLAVDPLGRAVFVTALMRSKVLVPLRKHDEYYAQRRANSDGCGDDEGLLNSSAAASKENEEGAATAKRRPAICDIISLGSPVEAHRQTIIFSICALEGATEHATFATLEQEIEEAKTSMLSTVDGGTAHTAGTANNVGGGQAFLRVSSSTTMLSHGAGVGGGRSNRVKQLAVYVFVTDLRQVQRTHLVSVPATAHRLISVPAAPYGPGGVIVCTDTELIWYDLLPQLQSGGGILGNSTAYPASSPSQSHLSGFSPLSLFKTAAPFPRRDDFRELLYDPMIIAHSTTCVQNNFFMLLQDDQGDVFRVSLTLMDVQRSYDALRMAQQQQQQQRRSGDLGNAANTPVTVQSPLIVSYFDTIPPTTTMGLFRRGFLFAGSESASTHGLYKIIKDGYSSDKEYILSRMRMVDQRHAVSCHDGNLEEAKTTFSSSAAANTTTFTNTATDNNNNNNNSNSNNVNSTGIVEDNGDVSKGATMMMPPQLPLPQLLQKTPQQNSRLVPLFLPHKSLKHMVLLESYPNTPAITSFVINIPQEAYNNENNNQRQQEEAEKKQHQQPHVQIDAVVGRGSDSVLVHARYGYAARLESCFTLPAVFSHLIPLGSAAALQERWRERQNGIAKANKSGKHRLTSRKALRSGPSVFWDDKLLLSTRQGTTVLSLALTGQVEADTLSGFITSEQTISAGTLRYGVGYVQITPTCIVVLPHRIKHTGSYQEEQQQQQQWGGFTAPVAESVTWMHPRGKRIVVADVCGNTMVVSFANGGGIASFDMGLEGTKLQQLEAIPSFPQARAISLLENPDAGANFFSTPAQLTTASSSFSSDTTLAAIATVNDEVYIVNPRKLREPLETIRCTNDDNRGSGAPPAIVSILLTYLGKTGTIRRLFCFLGHIDGTVTRCELDSATCKVIDRAVLTCGTAPCKMIAGDGERVCYVLCGELNWRCDVRDGVTKTVPWRFPSPQIMYASFRRPPISIMDSVSSKKEIEIPSTGAREEFVLGVAGNTLSLFAAQQCGGSSTVETALEYSFSNTQLPVAGRRLLQHPTRPEYLLVIGTEHRGYGVSALRRAAAAAAAAAIRQEHSHRSGSAGVADDNESKVNNGQNGAFGIGSGISLDKPQRSLNHPDHYISTLQLYNKRTDILDPPVYFQEGEAVLSAAVGSFVKDFGREPVLIVGCAEHYTHGSGCGVGASWTQGRLRAFRFLVSQSNISGSSGNGGKGAAPTLRLEQLHDTPITLTEINEDFSGVASSSGSPLYRATPLMDYPSALHICVDVGLLFVGMGPESGLQVYAWGQRRFLRKRRLPNVPSRIVAIETVFITPPGAASSTQSSLTYGSDLFRCVSNSSNIARGRRLLIVCGTLDQSVFIATVVQPSSSSGSTPSFLMLIARDAIPRSVTSIACLDERTIAVADRFGGIAFLRLPHNTRFGFAEPLHHMSDAELLEAERYAENEQVLEEIAVHYTGQLVTGLRAHFYDPSGGTDKSLALRILFYATALGAVGAYTPFVLEEDAALAVHLQPLIARHLSCPLRGGSGHLPYNTAGRMSATAAAGLAYSPVHNVVEGDCAQMLLRASTMLFSTEAKTEVEAELARRERAEAAQRKVLGLPPRTWPVLAELVAKQRALVTLPP